MEACLRAALDERGSADAPLCSDHAREWRRGHRAYGLVNHERAAAASAAIHRHACWRGRAREDARALACAGQYPREPGVAPGYFDTGRVRRRVRAIMQERGSSQAEATKEVSGGLPIGRLGLPDELAELVAFVVSRKAGFMTGATITIDGGGSRALF